MVIAPSKLRLDSSVSVGGGLRSGRGRWGEEGGWRRGKGETLSALTRRWGAPRLDRMDWDWTWPWVLSHGKLAPYQPDGLTTL